MAERARLALRQSQRLALNTELTTSLAILRMDAGGLTRFLEEQAARNPFLVVTLPPLPPGGWLPRWQSAFAGEAAPEAAAGGPSLMAHVLAEIARLLRDPRDRRIALVLAEALEPAGWLGRPLAALAAEAGCGVAEAEAVLMRLQAMEPTGLFARSLAECLALQAIEAGRMDAVLALMLDRLDLLAAGDLAKLARLARVPEAEIALRLRLIRSFDPKPGARFDPGAMDAREPDVVATRGAAGWEITLNRSALPTLQVNRPAVRLQAAAERAALAGALGLRRMVERRNTTLLRVVREVLAQQPGVLDHGLGALRPLTMAEVALALDLHESTVSRVVAGVALATPLGTWRLRALFGVRVGDRSAAAIRAEILRLIAAEPPEAPLTDAALTEALTASGCEVARRTVAKYREMLRIPVAGRRRRRAGRKAGGGGPA